MTKTQENLLTWALELADHGYALVPMRLYLKSDGKKGVIYPSGPGWDEQSTTDPTAIREMFAQRDDWTGVAIDTGKSKLIVIDLDDGGNKRGSQVWEEFPHKQQPSMTVRTQSGGRHLYFRDPTDGIIRNDVGRRIGPGVDIRAAGGVVYGPGSWVDGTDREYVLETRLYEPQFLDAPSDGLLKAITPPETKRDTPETHYQYPPGEHERMKRMHQKIVREAKEAPEGERDNTVYKCMCMSFQIAFTVPDDVLDEQKISRDYSKMPYSVKGLNGKLERARAWAYDHPMEHPWVNVPEIREDGPDWIMIKEEDYEVDPHNLDEEQCTDSGNGKRLVGLFKDRVRYVQGVGWLVWDGKVWRPETENSASVMQMVRSAQFLFYKDLQARVDAGLDTREAKRHVQYSLSNKGLKAAIEQMSNTYSIRLTTDDLDSHTHLLTVDNGIIDLRTGELRPHRPEYHLTRLVPTYYDPEAEAPRWVQFVDEVMPTDPELPDFLQRLVGYGITGEISEHAMVIHYGKGRNGKSVFLDTLRDIFSNISAVADWSSFERKSNNGGTARPDLVRLRGSRLVTVNEGEARGVMDEAQIKRMVAGDAITARGLYQGEIEYKPQFLLQMATNAKPEIAGADEGIWSRVKLIPWMRYFSPEERDPNLSKKLKDEAPGILAWAVRGAVEWYRNGLREPQVVKEATVDYRESNDILSGFIGDEIGEAWLIPEGNKKVPGAWTYALYRKWAETQGFTERDMLTVKKFKAAMEERGYPSKRLSGGMVYQGLAANMNIRSVAATRSEGSIRPDTATGEEEATVTEMF